MIFVGDGYDAEHEANHERKMVTVAKDDGTRGFTLFMKFEGSPAEVRSMEITATGRK